MGRMLRFGFLSALLVVGLAGPPRAAWAASLEDELFLAADAYYRGLDDRAERAFRDVLVRDPDNDYALARLGVVLAEKGDGDGARASLRKALAVAPDNLFAMKWLGILALRDGDAAEAGRRFQDMLDTDPGNAQATAWQGIGLMLASDRVTAVTRFVAASAADAGDPGLHYLLALAYQTLDLPENARLELEKTLELRPTDVPALTRLGLLVHRQGQRDLALAAWRQALAVTPDAVEARFLLSRSLSDEALDALAAGNQAQAGRLWRLALEADPGNGEAMTALAALPGPSGSKPDAAAPQGRETPAKGSK